MHLRTSQCCNHTFSVKDVKPPLLNMQQALSRKNDPNFYGGNVKKFSKAQCPECQTKYILWLKPDGRGSWSVVTISPEENASQPLPKKDDRDAIKAWLDNKGVEYHKQTPTNHLYNLILEHTA